MGHGPASADDGDPLKQVEALISAGRFPEARRLAERLLAAHPDDAGLWYVCGMAALNQDNASEAEKHLRRALELRADSARALNALGTALGRQGRDREALDCHEKAVELRPGWAASLHGMTAALFRLNRFDEIVGHYDRILAIEPRAWQAHANLGRTLEKLGRLDEAVESFRRADEIEPGNVGTMMETAKIQRVLSRLDAAGEILQRILRQDPENAEALFELGAVREETGDIPGAIELYRKSAAIDATASAAGHQLDMAMEICPDPAIEIPATGTPATDIPAAAASPDATAPETAMPGTKRVALHMREPFHYHIMRPIFDALRPNHFCLLTGHVKELLDFKPDIVVLADAHTPFLRHILPDALFVHVRHGLISKRIAAYAARVADFACITSDASRDWYLESNSRPRRDFWVTGYPQMDPLFRPEPLPMGITLEPGAKTVLYAPTWTPDFSSAGMLGNRLAELIRGKRADITLIIKPHPMTRSSHPEWFETWRVLAAEDDRIHLCDDPAADVMPYLKGADMLVSDASSVMFQFLAVDRPMVLITNPACFASSQFDPSGIEWRWRDIGEEIHEIADLADAVSRALDDPTLGAEARARYRTELFGRYTDGRAGERIAQNITELNP